MKAIVWLSSVVLVAAQKYRANNVIVGGAGRQTTAAPAQKTGGKLNQRAHSLWSQVNM